MRLSSWLVSSTLTALSVLSALGMLGCGGAAAGGGGAGGGGSGGDGGEPEPTPLPPLESASDTTTRTFAPVVAQAVPETESPALIEVQNELLAAGYGERAEQPGDALVGLTLDGGPAPAPAARTLVARFTHLADIQLADDESPIRLCSFDTTVVSGAYRPQDGHMCRVLNAMVRTLNAYHTATPLDFVLLGGDNADNAQKNEIEWVTRILAGDASVECDSGADDDPVPGPDNDPKDAFVAEGLDVPFFWVTGNHDILVQGNFKPELYAQDAVGETAATGTRDWSQPGGPVVQGTVPADPERVPLVRADMLAYLAARGDTGIDAATAATGKTNYAFDVEGTPLRVVVVDTAAATGASEGLLRQADVNQLVTPLLDAAAAEGKWVIVTSHHASARLTDGGGFGGESFDDAVTPDAFRALLGSYGNVLMHLGAHSHEHVVRVIDPAGGTPYWEVESESLADFPNQSRVFEVWDDGNGVLAIESRAIDFVVDGDPVAAEGLALATLDYTSGWTGDGRGDASARNVTLYVPMP
jgi:hypothetical protein